MLIFERAHKHPVFQQAQHVHIYRSTEDEVATWNFFEYAWGIGKEVYTPHVASDSKDLVHVRVTRITKWETGKYGIQQPVVESAEETVDASHFSERTAIVVPLVAFSASCDRVGYGKGYYDRFLSHTKGATIGLGYECQRVASIPTEATDVRLSCVASEERWYES